MRQGPVIKPIMEVLEGRRAATPPVWLMRQAGRYLPEYRAVRGKVETFLELCLTPALAAEVTLQPIRRFSFDAAILFSDILVVPHALGQKVSFETGEGPRLDAIEDAGGLGKVRPCLDDEVLEPVYATIRRVRRELPPDVALLGFCGAPWTVATYMVAGRGTGDQRPARLFAYRDPSAFGELMDILVRASASHLVRQFQSGADAVQIFDSWAGVLPSEEFRRWCVEPVRELVRLVRAEVPEARIIGFPRGAGSALTGYVESVPVNAVSVDWTSEPAFVREQIQSRVAVQGNLDPLALLAGGSALERAVDAVLAAFAARPFIFNLGHGVLPETPIAHVEQMVRRVRRGGSTEP